MSGKRDMRWPNWGRTLRRLRAEAEDLKAYDFIVIEPPNVEIPPAFRHGRTTAIVEESRPVAGADQDPATGRPDPGE